MWDMCHLWHRLSPCFSSSPLMANTWPTLSTLTVSQSCHVMCMWYSWFRFSHGGEEESTQSGGCGLAQRWAAEPEQWVKNSFTLYISTAGSLFTKSPKCNHGTWYTYLVKGVGIWSLVLFSPHLWTNMVDGSLNHWALLIHKNKASCSW